MQGWFSSPVPLPCCSSVDNKLPQASLQSAHFCQQLRVHKALRKWSKEPVVTLLSMTISTLWSVQGVGFEVLAHTGATFAVGSTRSRSTVMQPSWLQALKRPQGFSGPWGSVTRLSREPKSPWRVSFLGSCHF